VGRQYTHSAAGGFGWRQKKSCGRVAVGTRFLHVADILMWIRMSFNRLAMAFRPVFPGQFDCRGPFDHVGTGCCRLELPREIKGGRHPEIRRESVPTRFKKSNAVKGAGSV
jgi:hypothetical protein